MLLQLHSQPHKHRSNHDKHLLHGSSLGLFKVRLFQVSVVAEAVVRERVIVVSGGTAIGSMTRHGLFQKRLTVDSACIADSAHATLQLAHLLVKVPVSNHTKTLDRDECCRAIESSKKSGEVDRHGGRQDLASLACSLLTVYN
jgi:hypothetical protein